MSAKVQAEDFIRDSCPAIEHLFAALSGYNVALEKAQTTVEEIENSEQLLSDLFMYRDQWSPNANHYYVQYMTRMQEFEHQKQEAEADDTEKLEKALNSISATIESMSSLAGAVLQIAKQSLSLRHAGKPNICDVRVIGSQSVVEIIWEGRNHAMHWDEGVPRVNVSNMLNALEADLGITIEPGKNNCLSIIGALGWKTPDDVVYDLSMLVQ